MRLRAPDQVLFSPKPFGSHCRLAINYGSLAETSLSTLLVVSHTTQGPFSVLPVQSNLMPVAQSQAGLCIRDEAAKRRGRTTKRPDSGLIM